MGKGSETWKSWGCRECSEQGENGGDKLKEQAGPDGAGLRGPGDGLGCNSQSSRKLREAFEHGSNVI